MKKSTKGALAAGAAAVLLMGGVGTLAYWTDSATVDGGSVASGELSLSDVTCAANWTEGGATITKIVPGDTITKTCTGTLHLVGEHIGATVTLDPGSVADAEETFNDEVSITAELTSPSGGAVTSPGDHDVTVTISVAFDGPGATNATNVPGGLTAALDDLELVATQTHDTDD